ncbi:MAG: ABC transporter permease [Parabacteroides sp.]|nr:ABC transporter permease [Parabacteroides sp.]
MVKHVLKIIWAQRKSNGWILAELVIVMCALWFMVDKMWVDLRCYYAPMGYDITDTWRLKLSALSPNAPGYVPDSLSGSDPTRDLLTLVERIRQEQEIAEVCVTYWSMPYAFGNSWGGVYPLDGDTAASSGKSFHMLRVGPTYFDVFRVKDKEGRTVTPLVRDAYRPTVVTAEAEEAFFKGRSAVGHKISYNDDLSDPLTIVAVLPTFRSNDFDRPENCTFSILKDDKLEDMVKAFGIERAELSVRTRRPMTEDEMYAFLEGAAERMTVNNVFVYGVTLLADQRDTQLSFTKNENSKKLSMMAFLLANVFFGIVGTFWLRTERRRGEIGLRVAIGSSRGKLGGLMYLEGVTLLAITLPIVLLFAFNMAFLDKLDSYREPLTLLRFAATLGLSYLLMSGMICLGIWLPVRKAVRMAPAEALHYE